MKIILNIILLNVLNAILVTSVFAQNSICLSGIKDASLLTEKGKYDESIVLAKEILAKCDLSKNDKIVAYKILLINYLAIDNLEEADLVANLVLKINPNYEPDRLRDEPELIALFQKYKPTIYLKGAIFSGLNYSSAKASQTYSIVANNNTSGLDNYSNITGFQMAIGAEYKVIKSLWIQSCFIYRSSGYSINIPNVQGRTINYKEELTSFDFPITAKYYFLNRKIQPFVQAGFNFSFMNSALGELSRDDISDIIDRKPQRNEFYAGYTAGFGLSYLFKDWSIQAGTNYSLNPQNVNKEGTRYDNSDAIFKYYYLDNDFTLNNINVYVGITYALAYKNVLTSKKKK